MKVKGNPFKAKVAEKKILYQYTDEDLARVLGMQVKSFRNKGYDPNKFSFWQIKTLCSFLNFTNEERMTAFEAAS